MTPPLSTPTHQSLDVILCNRNSWISIYVFTRKTRLLIEGTDTFVRVLFYMNNKSVNCGAAGSAQMLKNASVWKVQMAERVKTLTFSLKYEFPFILS